MLPYVISIANEKGGVAKTTTTLSLGGALSEIGNRVLLIDMDPQGDLSLSLGIDNLVSHQSILSTDINGNSIKDLIKPTAVTNLHLIPSSNELRTQSETRDSLTIQNNSVKSFLPIFSEFFDYILLDCPPYLGLLTSIALNASNLLLIPTQSEYYSIFALQNMMIHINNIRNNGNASLSYRLLITMFDKRNGIHCLLANYLRETFKTGLFDTVIEVDTKLRESPLRGLPILNHATHSRAALQYRFLAQEIVNYAKKSD